MGGKAHKNDVCKKERFINSYTEYQVFFCASQNLQKWNNHVTFSFMSRVILDNKMFSLNNIRYTFCFFVFWGN